MSEWWSIGSCDGESCSMLDEVQSVCIIALWMLILIEEK